ncbi:MAG: hypothetical protein NUW12_12080 [Firmicutes bacterium]|jgi:hypothetical protein|nr:hypothetical protein [Bacillota bacterium]
MRLTHDLMFTERNTGISWSCQTDKSCALKAVVEFYDRELERPGEVVTAHISSKVKGRMKRGVIYVRPTKS